MVFPCELPDLYTTDVQTVPSLFRFDYMIRSRYVDLVLSCGDVMTRPNDLSDLIQRVWFWKNGLDNSSSQVDVKFGDSVLYTSIFSQ
jgi:hypothetical protein